MKTLKLFIVLLFTTIATTTYAQDKEVVYIRIKEDMSAAQRLDAFMEITYPDQTVKWIELEMGHNGAGKTNRNCL